MSVGTIDKLIINSAYREPESHWRYDRVTQGFEKVPGRRPAGYFIAGKGANYQNDVGVFVELPLVNMIRERVKRWRANGYPGVTGVTKKLLAHWNDKSARQYQFFYCQLDAIETLIWLTEAPEAEKTGINIPGDGGLFRRICTKLCTGGGKTAIMGMLIAWQVCNKVAYPMDRRYSKNVFVVAPGLTVKERLQELKPGGEANCYVKFAVVPNGMMEMLNQGIVEVVNCQALQWECSEDVAKKKTVDKRGAKSDEAYAREVLGRLGKSKNILVVNDEAHHAWRCNPEVKLKKEQKDEARDATFWVGGLDRIHAVRGILTCYDFSATPFAPSGKKNDEEALFGWIVSDFGLNDGIEAGLVKTPRVVVKDDGQLDTKTFKSKLYHIYADETVKDDLNRAADASEPLPNLVFQAYHFLGMDWKDTFEAWKKSGALTPPVMITVANRTETAARIKHTFDRKPLGLPEELCKSDKTIHIDSKTLDEAQNATGSKKEAADALRRIVNTVGKVGEPGEQVRNVVSVGMLTEGWDAKTVTHILGLRAFSSQLLCEQVVGRGLRRTTYDLEEGSELFAPEYVNIFGIPFTFLPHEADETTAPKPPPPKIPVEVDPKKARYEITWPNIVRIEREMKLKLDVDIEDIKPLTLNADNIRTIASLAPILNGNTDITKLSTIDLEKIDGQLRLQSIVFETAAMVYGQMQSQMPSDWMKLGTKYALFGQVVQLVEKYLRSGRISIDPGLFYQDELRRRIVYMFSMGQIVQHMWSAIKAKQSERLVPIFDGSRRVRGTGDMMTWWTSRHCEIPQKCHISQCVCDESWEATEAYILDHNDKVAAWVKNDHLGFEITYVYEGVVRKYIPDFLVRLTNGTMLVLEVKGRETVKDRVKRESLSEWIAAVNQTGEFDRWCNRVSYGVSDLNGIIAEVSGLRY